jgi:hypothetical protein
MSNSRDARCATGLRRGNYSDFNTSFERIEPSLLVVPRRRWQLVRGSTP